jgi:hypothetical protein
MSWVEVFTVLIILITGGIIFFESRKEHKSS